MDATTSVSTSPSSSPHAHNRQRKLLRSVLSRFGSKNSFRSASPSSSHEGSPSNAAHHNMNELKTLNGRNMSVDEEDLENDAEEIFTVIVNEEVFFVERAKNSNGSSRNVHAETADSVPPNEHYEDADGFDDQEGDLFSFEDMLHLKMHREHLQQQQSSDATQQDNSSAEHHSSVMSPSSSSRKLIRSLPRPFKSSSSTRAAADQQQDHDSKQNVLHSVGSSFSLRTYLASESTNKSSAAAARPESVSISSASTTSSVSSSNSLSALNVPAHYDEKHRMMLKDLSNKFRSSKQKVHQIDMTEEMLQVEQAIMDKTGKAKLTDALLPVKEDFLVKVHFCSAVKEYERMAEGKAKRTKGAKITRMFISKDSMFHLHGIPNQKYEYLELLKLVFLEELAASEIVRKTIEESK